MNKALALFTKLSSKTKTIKDLVYSARAQRISQKRQFSGRHPKWSASLDKSVKKVNVDITDDVQTTLHNEETLKRLVKKLQAGQKPRAKA